MANYVMVRAQAIAASVDPTSVLLVAHIVF
jgi:hypothetical protein